MLCKSAPLLSVKAGPQDGLAEGQFEALVAVMGNKDSVGDVIIPGAFDESLAEWKSSGNPLPIVWSHEYHDPRMHVGVALDAAEKDHNGKRALWVKGQLDLDEDDEIARKVGRLLKGRRVNQFSFTYDVQDGAFAKSDELGEYFELRKLKLYEVGPTLIGANQETELINAKAFDRLLGQIKAGRVLSAANETKLRNAYESIGAVLSTLESDDGKATADAPAKSEEPSGPSSRSPGVTPAMRSALLEIELAAG